MCNMQIWIDLAYLSTAYAWDTYYYMLDCMLWESVWPRDFAGQKHIFKQKRKANVFGPTILKKLHFKKHQKPRFKIRGTGKLF